MINYKKILNDDLYITELYIDNYKSFNDFTFRPQKHINIIYGDCASGKSNLIDLFKVIGSILHREYEYIYIYTDTKDDFSGYINFNNDISLHFVISNGIVESRYWFDFISGEVLFKREL